MQKQTSLSEQQIQSQEPEDQVCDCEVTVLIVDDNAFNLLPLEMILGSMGIMCEQALGGQEAIDMFIQNRTKTCCKKKF